ncbi:MAG TPA: glycoside hydrolase family 20 zincin-like fold domain-containing protein, partial [Ignavibacteriales bacterium]|nr:glycoside hydrolase family 20 zincin-like fold domain-containing protein [Ignavibacteriales bacterium]
MYLFQTGVKNFFRIFIFFLAAGYANTAAQESSFPLIPKPEKTEWLEGKFYLSGDTDIACSDKVLQEYFILQVNSLTGVKLKSGAASSAGIVLNLTKEKMDAEEYKLSIMKERAEITASSKEGLFRGMQTFFQLIPPAAKADKNNS